MCKLHGISGAMHTCGSCYQAHARLPISAQLVSGRLAMQARTVTVISAALAVSMFFAVGSLANRAEEAGFEDGVVHVRSAYPLAETVERLQKDVAYKGIMMFSVIDQAKLAADAGI